MSDTLQEAKNLVELIGDECQMLVSALDKENSIEAAKEICGALIRTGRRMPKTLRFIQQCLVEEDSADEEAEGEAEESDAESDD